MTGIFLNIFTQSFEQYSILWLLLSGVIGGLISSTIKFLYDQVWGPALQQRRATKTAIANYKYPLLRAADTLDRRIQNFYQYGDPEWYNSKTDNYYRRTMQYVFGSYFGWSRILEQEAGLFEPEGRIFNTEFYRVFKGLTSFYYLKDFANANAGHIEKATIPRFALTAMGELMINKNAPQGGSKTNGSIGSDKVIGFLEFLKLADTPEFLKWFGYLDNLFNIGRKTSSDLKWNRVLIFATNLRVFVNFLDPNHKLTAGRSIYYLNDMDSQVAAVVRKELVESGFDQLIAK